jgi:hypothetical protein
MATVMDNQNWDTLIEVIRRSLQSRSLLIFLAGSKTIYRAFFRMTF